MPFLPINLPLEVLELVEQPGVFLFILDEVSQQIPKRKRTSLRFPATYEA
jgi:hypothetical protein